MCVQNDLDLAMDQLNGLPAEALSLYAYAAFKLLREKRSCEVKNGSFEVCIENVPEYSKDLQHEIPMDMLARISVSETLTIPEY